MGAEPVKIAANYAQQLAQTGFAILPRVLDEPTISELIHALSQTTGPSTRQRQQKTYAIRNLLETVPAVRHLAGSPAIRSIIEPILGPNAQPVRGLLFDKTPEANWKVAWHQDLTIAVQKRADVPGFGPWTLKAGVQHVQPPLAILETMLTLRLHLDDCEAANGPLQVLPGSHQSGKLTAADILQWRSRVEPINCTLKRGGALLMRPLLLHASAPAQNPAHRRVIHLEFSSQTLPSGLNWLSTSPLTN